MVEKTIKTLNVYLKGIDGQAHAMGVLPLDLIENYAVIERNSHTYIYERLFGGNNIEYREVLTPYHVTEF